MNTNQNISVYQQIKDCQHIDDDLKKETLRRLRKIQMTPGLRKQCKYMKYLLEPNDKYCIGFLFTWENTPEGGDFWNRIYKALTTKPY